MLDTDGVNAFASPGGFVHITRGALGLVRNEAELAGVLGARDRPRRPQAHRQRDSEEQGGGRRSQSGAGGSERAALDRLANQAYAMVLENSFDRGDELDADRVGVQLA